MNNLTPEEQKLLRKILMHRSECWRRMRRHRAMQNSVKRSFLIVACALAAFAGSMTARAADSEPVSAAALFNEANAEQTAGNLGPAILGYERARMLAPNDAAIQQNLSVAREKAGVVAPKIPAWQKPAHALSFDALAILASSSLAMLCLIVFGTRLIPTTLRRVSSRVAAALGVVGLLAASGLALRWPDLARAVIVSARATAHIAPASASARTFELKPGELVQARREHGDFVLVRTLDERSGWVAKSDVERIVPDGPSPSPM